MTGEGWAKPPRARARHYYEQDATKPICGGLQHQVIGPRDPEPSKELWVDCQRCTVILRMRKLKRRD